MSDLADNPPVLRGHGGWRPNSGRPRGVPSKMGAQLKTLRNEALSCAKSLDDSFPSHRIALFASWLRPPQLAAVLIRPSLASYQAKPAMSPVGPVAEGPVSPMYDLQPTRIAAVLNSSDRPFADPDAVARMLIELANAYEPVQDKACGLD